MSRLKENSGGAVAAEGGLRGSEGWGIGVSEEVLCFGYLHDTCMTDDVLTCIFSQICSLMVVIAAQETVIVIVLVECVCGKSDKRHKSFME